MSLWHVTTAATVYETYVVEAETAGQAERAVASSAKRAALPSFPDGDGGDEEVIAVRVVRR